MPAQRPEVYNNSPTQANALYNPQPATVVQSQAINDPPVTKSRKKLIIIASVVGGVIFLLIIAVILGGGSKQPTSTKAPTSKTTETQALKPAQAIEIEEANNALSQDLSSTDDEKDLPAASLEDKTLSL